MWKKAAAFLWRQKIFLAALAMGGFIVFSLSTYHRPGLKEPDVAVAADTAEKKTEEDGGDVSGVFDLEDGVYQGTGTGYGGPVTVEVTIKDGRIESISILSAPGEGASFLSRAKAVIDAMIQNQSMDVDTVSGATYSSRGIIEAVKNALTGETSTSQTAAGASAKGDAGSVGTVDENVSYEDGTYTGSAQGFGGTIKVEVTVKNGKIKSIKVLSASGETASYFNKAKKLIKTIISRQSTNVDAVSGATYSSNGLIKAVRNALSKAEQKDSKEKEKSADSSKIKKGTLPYADGVYYGTGEGYAGEITVALLIRDKTLQAAVITDTVDGDSYIARAEKILDRVVKKQSAKVDVVSGATYSSKGIIEAVKNALKAAAAGKTGLDAIDNPNKSPGGNENTDSPGSAEEGEIYQNGTYTGSAQCTDGDEFNYMLDVEITVAKDKITGVIVVDKSSTDREWKNNLYYINLAKKSLPARIIAKGSPEGVDAVSGATYSSNALLEACRAALEKAKK